MSSDLADADFDTRAIRFAQQRTHEHEHSEAIFTTSSFVFDNAAHAAAVFSGQQPGNVYGRFNNPTVRTFEKRLASLEGGESCVATSSGMAAILATVMTLLQAGDHMVASKSLFGATIGLFDNYLKKFGVEVTYVSLVNTDEWAGSVTPKTKIFFAETPSNPLTEVADIQALADIAHDCDATLVIDNCFCTPAIQRPLESGADIVIHSATKYLDGQGRAVGGAVVGDSELVGEKMFSFIRTAGPSMSPFNAWVFTRGLETLSLRMRAHSENAKAIAGWLESHGKIKHVYYTGLESHPQYDIVRRQQSDSGGIVAFDVTGGREAAWRVIDRVKLISITANLGDVKTTITHPTSTTHHRISAEQREAMGIGDGLLRVAAGLESTADLIADLQQALA